MLSFSISVCYVLIKNFSTAVESKKWTWLEASGEDKDSELFWPCKEKIPSTQINSTNRKINHSHSYIWVMAF